MIGFHSGLLINKGRKKILSHTTQQASAERTAVLTMGRLGTERNAGFYQQNDLQVNADREVERALLNTTSV